MRHPISICLIAATLSAGVSPAFAWNALGHRVAAEIAWQEITPEQRKNIVDTLKRHPRFAEDFLAKMPADVAKGDQAKQDRWIFWQSATWPDIARGTPYDRPWWHFINVPIYVDRSDRKVLSKSLPFNQSFKYPTDGDPEDYNVVQAIKNAQSVIADKNATPDARALAYCWLMHLVGDLHQPLHSCALVSVNQYPRGDKGGNNVPLTRGRNLHSLWDNLLGRDDDYSNVLRVANELADREPYGDVWDSAGKETDLRKWTVESHLLAEESVYDAAILDAIRSTPAGAQVAPITPSDEYLKAAGAHARRRVVAGGIRLGKALE